MLPLRVCLILLVVFAAYVCAQTCFDLAYDCPGKLGLCYNQMYKKLMTKMCNASCAYCKPTP
ncbi:hypothetical protein PRIPAC_93267 [Pristionchus pacificus]|uniref:ShKT domain-containing protein n=1 Tax=Pristionchus pacificus TaxID=54126 RepID=A0A2A6CEE3_PRIPA|nr:hypothetical protein PRIPAC_93267 [Pristionchus pacificus]|eukprot:PDM76381.1 hypothetical protein PRIPAC_39985 [Pristionchus pacificus]